MPWGPFLVCLLLLWVSCHPQKAVGHTTDLALHKHMESWHWLTDFPLSCAPSPRARVKLEHPGAQIQHQIHFHVFASHVTQDCCILVTVANIFWANQCMDCCTVDCVTVNENINPFIYFFFPSYSFLNRTGKEHCLGLLKRGVEKNQFLPHQFNRKDCGDDRKRLAVAQQRSGCSYSTLRKNSRSVHRFSQTGGFSGEGTPPDTYLTGINTMW